MVAPWWWRVLRAASGAVAVGFTVLAVVAIAESMANADADAGEWSLGKAEEIGWMYALIVVPVLLLTPLPRAWGWGFAWALTPLGLTWYTYHLAASVSGPLHYADPLWIDAVALAVIYLGLVPWESWTGLVATLRQRSQPARAS